MKKSILRACASAVALAAAASIAAPTFAQDAAAPADSEETGLDEIVVTASGRDKSRLDSSVSVTSVDAELVDAFKPSSEAEVFRMIPGIQVPGTSGPGGNSNIAVRGLPVATGGSPFVQIQEDGLPVVLFGDIQFGNNDYWTRFDASVERVESVRGGGSTTFASQAPGAVINYISHTGKKEGGFVSLSKGVNYDETKVDFRYGGPINDTLRFHLGGQFKTGRGPLGADFNVSDSIQVKGNVTQDIADGNGYFRLLFKVADTQEPNYTGAPALATLSGNKISNVQPFPGFDGRNSSNYSIYNRDFLIYNRTGQLERVEMSGISTKQTQLGGQLHYEFDGGVTVDNNFRWSKLSGSFASPFLNVRRAAGIVGSTVNGQVVGSIRYASGPNAGQVFTGTYVDDNVNVRTNIRDLGSLANDLTIAGKFALGAFDLTARGGFFYMNQDIAMDWHVNKSLREVSGNNPSQLDLYNTAGARMTVEGISGYNNNWGNCCARDYDLSYTNTAPYAALELDSDDFAIDGSVRFENIKASGGGRTGGAEFNVNSNGVLIPTMTANGASEVLDYSRNYVSWTAGALWKANSNTSLFVRASRGGRFNGDRQTFGGKIASNGALCTGAMAAAGTMGCSADGVTPSVDFVKQYELGLKNRGDLAGGRYTVEITALKGNFKQSTFELSATRCPGGSGGCVIDARYKSYGAEFYGTYNNGGFTLVGNATWTKATRSGVGSGGTPTPFTRAPYMPDLVYTVQANYDILDAATLGLNVTGQTSIIDDAGRQYPGGAVVGVNLRVMPLSNIELGIQGYNVFNRYDLRGSGNIADGSTSPIVLGTGPALGRTWTASVKYSF
ncbi:outer membrane receptor protein involved in Fe transport [Novosphingobium kunmingense]|uniref:Outer membrane receptor protein involved in Fe transport n=1 Tax=Novosphingobium kunmingense TaxID=1211806 RepID=A0A2N0H3H5_9SPHN|nr:TonB-dependent receptor [Novosphingobium kunmingense]PKB13477.1 outer membrane receptor protein involved in Fe transport [Novosphingobium kunmingense]